MTRVAGRRATGLRGNREFLYLWTGAGLSFLGSRVSASAYPLVVLWATGSAAAAGLVAFAAQLPFVVAQLPAGVIADRFDRRRLMILCDLGRVVVIGTVLVLWIFSDVAPVHLAVVGFLEGTLTVVYRVAERAALPSVVTPEQIPAATSRNEARERAAGLLGQPGAGVLTAIAQWAPFLYTAVAHVLSLGTLMLMKSSLRPPVSTTPQRMWPGLREGLAWMWRQRFARAALLLIAVSNLLFQVLLLAILVAVRDGGGSTTSVALVTAVAGLGGVAGSLCAPWCLRRLRLATVVISANVAWAGLVPFMALTSNPVLLGVVFGLIALVGAVFTVAVSVHLVEIVPESLRGRIASIASLMAYGPLAFGSLAGGFMLDRAGVVATVLVAAAGMGVLVWLTAASIGHHSRSENVLS